MKQEYPGMKQEYPGDPWNDKEGDVGYCPLLTKIGILAIIAIIVIIARIILR